jgi:hypothetical protein
MQRIAVGFREDSNCSDAELFASADDAQRDLAAIGYENFFEHEWRLTV